MHRGRRDVDFSLAFSLDTHQPKGTHHHRPSPSPERNDHTAQPGRLTGLLAIQQFRAKPDGPVQPLRIPNLLIADQPVEPCSLAPRSRSWLTASSQQRDAHTSCGFYHTKAKEYRSVSSLNRWLEGSSSLGSSRLLYLQIATSYNWKEYERVCI